MENKWTLHIQELGKIQSADITAAPLTLFVGDNNSGKSYLMAVLYSLMNVRFYQQRYDLCKKEPEYTFCAEWIRNQFERCESDANGSERKRVVKLRREVREQFGVLLNKVLKKNLDKIARYAFNTNVSIGGLAVTLPDIERQRLLFEITKEADDDLNYAVRPYTNGKAYTKARTYAPTDSDFLVGFILEYLLKAEWKFAARRSAFLPTSRTGFLLTYKSLVRASISNAYEETEEAQQEPQRLTRPCSDFLKNLAELSEEKKSDKYNNVIRLIESRMVCGHISLRDNTPQSDIYYHPDAADLDLPMHLVSGVVTELTPLLLMLEYSKDWQILFMEEPEIGLHPALQAEMARVLVKMRNKNIPVFITTHSDTILQGLNNFIKLSRLPEQRREQLAKQYSYDPEDMLYSDDVAMYQFDVDPVTGRSEVRTLECTEYGFVVPTFNSALSNLLKETQELEVDDEVPTLGGLPEEAQE